jgi:antitoxin (DNA-binding transcriptional repressor) of toxin-antitoxin stability system
MSTIAVEEAQARLVEIIQQLMPGEEVVLTQNERPVATLKASPPAARAAPQLGTLKGTILRIAPEFDAIPEGFEEYLP